MAMEAALSKAATAAEDRKLLRKRCSFTDIHCYLTTSKYPHHVGSKGQKANFRRSTSMFCLDDEKLYYRRKVKHSSDIVKLLVIWTADEVEKVLKEVHECEDMGGITHRGISATASLITSKYYWRTVLNDVHRYVRACPQCHRSGVPSNQASAAEPAVDEIKEMSAFTTPMQQISVDIIPMPESNGCSCYVLAIDYFTKWSEAEPLPSCSPEAVAAFLRKLYCRHGCTGVQINDEGKEFGGKVGSELHRLTGVYQEISCTYLPQANSLVEKENWTIKEDFKKLLETRPDDWVRALDGLLFGHRTAVHKSTGHSPFFMLYARYPKLVMDVVFDQKVPAADGEEGEFDTQYVEIVMKTMMDLCLSIVQDE